MVLLSRTIIVTILASKAEFLKQADFLRIARLYRLRPTVDIFIRLIF